MTPVSDGLAATISAAIAAHDPLDPWLVQSNYEEHYWDDEAKVIAPMIASATTATDVYDALASTLRPLVRHPAEDDYARERLQASAADI